MAASDKDTIYVDIDDEITGVIDKLQASGGKVVALVLPKRAAVFQSIVNMKLLKRAADGAKKNVVLITTEAGLLPLAGAAGIHVARTLTSRPEIPAAPEAPDESEETVQEDETAEPLDTSKPIGQLAGAGAPAAAADGVETLTLDDDEVPPEDAPKAPPKKDFTPPKGKKKLKIPNFERFRLILILGGALLLILIIGFAIASSSLKRATITIKTDATNVNTNVDLTLSTTATKLTESNNTLPAKLVSQQKTYTQTVATTGQKNNGNKASGSVTMTAKKCSGNPFESPTPVPAGTGLSHDGQTYITQEDTSFHGTGTDNGCYVYTSNGSTEILAQASGTSSNTSNGSFSVAGRSDVSATGSASGGTDNIVKSVNQNDINNAKAKINTNDGSVKSALQSQLQKDGYYAITSTFSAGTPEATNSAPVGGVADTVTVTEVVTYTMFGAHKADLDTVLANDINSQIDTGKQKIQDNGLSKGTFNVTSQSATGAQITLTTKAVAGPDLDTESVRQTAAGKKPGAVKDELSDNPDVVSVDVKLSPFWVSSIPKNPEHITVKIAEPSTTAKASSDGGGN